MDAAIRNQGASIKTVEIQIGQMSKVLQERGFRSLLSSIETNPRGHVKSIATTIESDASSICCIGSSQYVVSTGQNSTLIYDEKQMMILFLTHLNDYYCEGNTFHMDRNFQKLTHMELHISIIPQKEKDPGSFTLPCYINNVCFDNAFVDLGARVNFAVLEDMDAYRDEGIGDVIFGEPFLREVGIKARWFDGMITIYNGNESVTYQMVRSHPRFKHHTNKQYNMIPPLLKVSEEDKMNGISYSYQKLKGFCKGFLNLGPDFIRVPSMEEWLTRGHISVHEMEW
nr:hypothetical protein [Tanacetum cinerariifolium]